MSKSKASDYLTAGISLIIMAVVIWLVENFVLNGTVDSRILLLVPSVFVTLSISHLVIAGAKWYSSR